uniref:Uncharacterized protein n=1 Tax=Rousettus aegyptiacus TaxID=9407 RepID=A0A7J8KBR2_ROUAE|nr:hypothetical protein HJG63_008018 [Rousettus aegyptiacus]
MLLLSCSHAYSSRLMSRFSCDGCLRRFALKATVFRQEHFLFWAVPQLIEQCWAQEADFGRKGRPTSPAGTRWEGEGRYDLLWGGSSLVEAENLVMLLLESVRSPLGVWSWGSRTDPGVQSLRPRKDTDNTEQPGSCSLMPRARGMARCRSQSWGGDRRQLV